MTTPRPAAPRIPPLRESEWSDKDREVLEQSMGGPAGAVNIFTTLVRHRRLFRRWSAFAGVLLTGTLPARDRELVILRTGWLCRARYEWGQHVRIARQAGMTDEEIERITQGAGAPGWTPLEVALVTATDELHEDGCISDPTWSVLAGAYTEEQLIEVPMVIGQYHLVSFTLNSLGVQPEAGLPVMPGDG